MKKPIKGKTQQELRLDFPVDRRSFVIRLNDGRLYRIVPKDRVNNRLNSFLLGLFIGSIVCGFVAFDGAKRVYQLNKIVTSMTEQLGMCETYKEKIK